MRRQVPERLARPRRVAWLCGRAAAPALRRIAAELSDVEGLRVEVHEVENGFFGPGVVVSGLLTGADIVRALEGVEADVVMLPRGAFGMTGTRTLDEVSLEQVEAESSKRFGKDVARLSSMERNELFTAISTSGDPQTADAHPLKAFLHLREWIAGSYYSSEIGMRELGWTPDRVFAEFPGCSHIDVGH